ncbi:hypothetical protein [Methylocapsa sp. S129]|uniref:phosphoribosyltransferase-like protein n=1 Tax=Methylocapsa sp. S129 TaxID=1641869 RepID=UPI00131CDC11|nr:hypothetical protein [Methylocapsa sp. S129]
MANLLRLSEHPLSQQWLALFRTSEDRAAAAQLLNLLKLVSAREFETGIERALADLQRRINATIAVYPIAPPLPGEIIGYDPFVGGIARHAEADSRNVGKRRKYGSEDRVGHLLAKLQAQFGSGKSHSSIECNPTLTQLKTQGIRHIVLVDDVCGSGKRITDYWRVVPNRIKSLLSLKRYELWIVLYAITSSGRTALTVAMPNFPIADHLITVLPDVDIQKLLPPSVIELCGNYAKLIGRESSALGYRGSACPVVFEHGCPNNLPAILWADRGDWKGLFPNRAVPTDMRSCFDENGTIRAIESLWRINQRKLALSLLDALDRIIPLNLRRRMMLSLLGLCLRGVPETELPRRLLVSNAECQKLLRSAARTGLYDNNTSQITPLGREFVVRFRARFGDANRSKPVGKDPAKYYPQQCEGEFRKLGKTDRS